MDSEDLSLFNKQQRFGGHHKLREYDEAFVSPLLANAADYFAYSSDDGEIFSKSNLAAADKNRAEYTINLLNLNAPYLKNLRKTWLQELQDEIDKLVDEDSIEGIEYMAKCELLPYQRYYSGTDTQVTQLRQFHTPSLRLFGSVGQRVLVEHYPQGL